MENTTLLWLRLSMVPGFGWHLAKKINQILPLQNLFDLSIKELQLYLPLKKEKLELIRSLPKHKIEQEIKHCEKNNIHLIPIESSSYPSLLKEISSPPLILYIKGKINLLNTLSIGIVGARNPTVYGQENAYRFSRDLAVTNLTIISGLAIGIDTLAHQGALASSGNTIAVLGCGFSQIYPKQNLRLSEKICEKGSIITEFPFLSPPLPQHFPRRNRIIAGLSAGILVIEAAIKSGSLITAKYALQENREIFAIPGNINNNLSRGVNQLIKQGAKLIENIDDILSELSHYYTQGSINFSPSSVNGLADKPQSVYDAISYTTTEVDVIVKRTGLNASLILSILTHLELDGYISKAQGGYLKIRRPYERKNS